MNRIKIIVFLFTVLLLTGCGNNLKCNIKTNNYTADIKITFEKEKPAEYSFKDKMTFSYEDFNSELYYHNKYTELSDLITEKYAKVSDNKDNVTIKINYDFSKYNSKGESKLLIKRSDTKKEALKKIESLGYKCK